MAARRGPVETAEETVPGRAERVLVVSAAAVLPVVLGYLGIAALVGLAVLGTSAAAVDVLLAAAPGWLAAHGVALVIDGHRLGVLPLLPTVLLMFLVGRTAAFAAARLRMTTPAEAGPLVAAIAGTHGVVAIGIALGSAESVATAAPAVALVSCAAVSGLAATIGVARRCGITTALLGRFDAPAVTGLRAGLLGAGMLLTAGAAVVVLGLVTSWSGVVELFRANGSLGLFLLCAGYLPNAAIAGASFLAGPGVSIGTVSAGPLLMVAGPVPGVPLLAALPESQAVWFPALLVVPAAIGALLGWRYRASSADPLHRVRTIAIAAVVVAGVFFVLAAAAGGPLAGGRFDPVTVPAGLLAVMCFGWIALPGMTVAWWAGPRPLAEDPDPEPVDDPDTEGEPEDSAESEVEADSTEDSADDTADDTAEDGADDVAEDAEEPAEQPAPA